MSEHRPAIARALGSSTTHRRWLIGAVAVLGAGGLAFGGLGIPVSADEINAAGNVHASADVQDDCVTAAVGTGEADGGLNPQQGSEPAPVRADGQGEASVSVCRDDLGGTPPGDPGDPDPGDPGSPLPDDLGGIVPDDLEDILPGDGGGSDPGGPGGGVPGDIDNLVPGDPGGLIPGGPGGGGPGGGGPGGGGPGGGGPGGGGPGGGGPGGGGPGGGGGVLPGAVRSLVGDALGLVPGVLDRLAQIPPVTDGGGPDGTDGGTQDGGSGVNPASGGTASGPAVVAGAGAESDVPADSVLGADIERDAPTGPAVSPGATLPRTGGGLGSGLVRAIAFLGLGRALFGFRHRRRPVVVNGCD